MSSNVIPESYQAITGEGTASEKKYNIKVLSSGLPTASVAPAAPALLPVPASSALPPASVLPVPASSSAPTPPALNPAPALISNSILSPIGSATFESPKISIPRTNKNPIKIVPIVYKQGDLTSDFSVMIKDPKKTEKSLFIYNENFTQYVSGDKNSGGGTADLRPYRRDIKNNNPSDIKALGIPTGFLKHTIGGNDVDKQITTLLNIDASHVLHLFDTREIIDPTTILNQPNNYESYLITQINDATINNDENAKIIESIFYISLYNIYNYVIHNNIDTIYYSADNDSEQTLGFSLFLEHLWTKNNKENMKTLVKVLLNTLGRNPETLNKLNIRKWLKNLYGFDDYLPGVPDYSNPTENQKKLKIPAIQMIGGDIGVFTTPSLDELRKEVELLSKKEKNETKTTINFVSGDVIPLFKQNHGATFQVASQFNCLEMTSKNVTPSHGIGIYYMDPTQGPACSIACSAGTVHRNYTHNIGTKSNEEDQVHNIDILLETIHNPCDVQNGYTTYSKYINATNRAQFATDINTYIGANPEYIKGLLKVGVHKDVGVTYDRNRDGDLIPIPRGIKVCQVFCSAMSFQDITEDIKTAYAPLAQVILYATYEATILQAYLNKIVTKNNRVFLTLVGGGVFSNNMEWVLNAIQRAFHIATNLKLGLEIYICKYEGKFNEKDSEFIRKFAPSAKFVNILSPSAGGSRKSRKSRKFRIVRKKLKTRKM